ncbi:MAG: aspartate aminotransferase family protein, partial [Desulfobacteraceae bacterium]
MQNEEFRKYAHQLADWMADYYQEIREFPVMSRAKPKDIFNQLPENPPDQKKSFAETFQDFQKIILPGITHWQHPRFFAYFPANVGYPAILAEMLTAALGVQGMLWQTSPAAAELEDRIMLWLREMIGLPADFTGVIQDSASSATLCSILTAREQKTGYQSNGVGLYERSPFTVYCSTETHSSTEKAVKIIGLGNHYLRKIPVDRDFAMNPDELRKAIETDQRQGLAPLCVVATLGTTGSTALDPLEAIGRICQEHDLWLHVDAAYAGTALLLPEMRFMLQGIEAVNSFVFNPHKWMFTGLDCSAYFVKDPGVLIRTLEILPEYLKTDPGDRVNNYRDWGLGLGRRFRALKLWLVISTYGVSGLQNIIRDHMTWARELA